MFFLYNPLPNQQRAMIVFPKINSVILLSFLSNGILCSLWIKNYMFSMYKIFYTHTHTHTHIYIYIFYFLFILKFLSTHIMGQFASDKI